MSKFPVFRDVFPDEAEVVRWMERSFLGLHGFNSHTFGWIHALQKVAPARRDYWIEVRRHWHALSRPREAEIEAFFLQYLEPVHANSKSQNYGLRDRRTSIAFLRNKTKKSRDLGFDSEWHLKRVIFSCDGERAALQDKVDYARKIGCERFVRSEEPKIALFSNESQRSEALASATRNALHFVPKLELIVEAYPEHIYCPHQISGVIWPFLLS
jgi:hypothetical protein